METMTWCNIIFGFLTLILATHQRLHVSADEIFSISQISPRSDTISADERDDTLGYETTAKRDVIEIEASTQLGQEQRDQTVASLDQSTAAQQQHVRVERSALPVLNDFPSIPSLTDHKRLRHMEANDVDSSGRYFGYISPTRTDEDTLQIGGEMTQIHRTGKDLGVADDGHFLEKGDLRLTNLSRSLINPSSATQTLPIATQSHPNQPRQNQNPDIQDIITGIVKLLNGNVNVHANTQASRRPIATRINNRGPPRISESQPLPGDYEASLTPPTTSMRPPYPFDRPEGPIRPFLTGVPLPEQIVPSMQQNYRPGFVSQNRPPWQRPRPRPPISSNRRPIPPYKPNPPMPEYRPEDDIALTTTVDSDINLPYEMNLGGTNEEDLNSSYGIDDPAVETAPSLPAEIPVKKDEISKKKDKVPEKKPILSSTPPPMPKTSSAPSAAPPATTPRPTSPSTTTTTTTTPPPPPPPTTPEISTETKPEAQLQDTVPSNAVLQSSIEDYPLTLASSAGETPQLSTSQMSATAQFSFPAEPSSASAIVPTKSSVLRTTEGAEATPSHVYHPRPGIVLDDPEFKPGGNSQRPQLPQRPRQPIQASRPHPSLPGYGEIFDITLSAIQGPGSGSGSKQTVNIKPYGAYPVTGNDILLAPSGDQGFVSIDGKRTYINLFGEQTDAPVNAPSSSSVPVVQPTKVAAIPPITGTGYAIPENDIPEAPIRTPQPVRPHQHRPTRPTQPPVRIDTCIVGDDTTCDQAQNEKCQTENGVSSCHCRPGYARRKHREPCRRIVSLMMSLRVDKIYERRVVWDDQLAEAASEPAQQLSFEAVRAIDSAMSMTPFSDEFLEVKVNSIYNGDASQGAAGVFVNLTLKLEENAETLRPQLKSDIQRHLLGVIHRRNNNIGNSALYVESPPGSVSNLQDLDECTSPDLNDCHPEAICSNIWGSFRCECSQGLRDPWADQPQRAGRECNSCPESFCNNRGVCSYDNSGNQVCSCVGSYYGAQCEIDGEVLGVAIGASVAAVIIIVLTLICLVMWSRRWHREHKNAIGSPVFGYMGGGQVKTPAMGQAPYQVTLEDRMRWAQIADVMAQANHYGAEPVNSTRPSSAIFGYPNLQTISNMNSMGTLGTLSLAGTLPMHHSGTLPPVPLPRLGLNRPNGMRTLENSSSSEEEDRTDLLGRNFQVPRPKSRSNASVTSGIYYDVDYAPSGGVELYGGTHGNNSISNNSMPGPQGIPMSTYTSGRAQQYYK